MRAVTRLGGGTATHRLTQWVGNASFAHLTAQHRGHAVDQAHVRDQVLPRRVRRRWLVHDALAASWEGQGRGVKAVRRAPKAIDEALEVEPVHRRRHAPREGLGVLEDDGLVGDDHVAVCGARGEVREVLKGARPTDVVAQDKKEVGVVGVARALNVGRAHANLVRHSRSQKRPGHTELQISLRGVAIEDAPPRRPHVRQLPCHPMPDPAAPSHVLVRLVDKNTAGARRRRG
mmetsp:Transcript_10338/g.28142  ORF Transcript_10338/g.28142 Transcript_10338/m.28142 type:complete len:232 (+) Transcript_10338:891-1586(+)